MAAEMLAIWTVAGQLHEVSQAIWTVGILGICAWVLFK